MNIPQADWESACGGYAIDERGELWRIIGFIDRPTVILDPVKQMPEPGRATVKDDRDRQYLVMGAPNSREFRRLIPEPAEL